MTRRCSGYFRRHCTSSARCQSPLSVTEAFKERTDRNNLPKLNPLHPFAEEEIFPANTRGTLIVEQERIEIIRVRELLQKRR